MLMMPPPEEASLILGTKKPPPLPGVSGYVLEWYGVLEIIRLQLSGQLLPPNPP